MEKKPGQVRVGLAQRVFRNYFFLQNVGTCVILDGYWNRQTGRHKELRFLDFILLGL